MGEINGRVINAVTARRPRAGFPVLAGYQSERWSLLDVVSIDAVTVYDAFTVARLAVGQQSEVTFRVASSGTKETARWLIQMPTRMPCV
jgi:hypothetical protein